MRMRLRAQVTLVTLVAATLAFVAASAPSRAAAPSLEAALTRALSVPGVDPQKTAALVVDMRTGDVVFDRNSRLALRPASAEKLAVSFGALRFLGPGYRFRTEVVGSGALDGHVWDGDLVLVGHGDPTLDLDDVAALARDVRSWGIRR